MEHRACTAGIASGKKSPRLHPGRVAMRLDRFEIDRAVYAKVDNLHRRERDVHDAMLEAPVEEAPIYFAAMHRLQAEIRHYLRMSSKPSTANLKELGLR